MYRILQESVENYMRDPATRGERQRLAEPIRLIANPQRYHVEKEQNTKRYQETQKLLVYLQQEADHQPRYRTLLWHLESREITPSEKLVLDEENRDFCESQAKILLQLIRLSYWH